MSPNFEMALFTAQVTDSAILTDSRTRWEEIKTAQVTNKGVSSYPLKDVSDLIADKKLIFCADPQRSFNHSIRGNCRDLRKLFREILNEAKMGDSVPSTKLINRYKNDFQKGYASLAKTIDEQEEYLFRGKMNFLIPKGGFVHNNVQRLLLKSGSQHHLNSVSMAIFLEVANW
jgi:hypothetical protein